METVLLEQNIISLRTAVVLDDSGVVSFMLIPVWADSPLSLRTDFGKTDATYLYRRKGTLQGELKLIQGLGSIERDIRPMAFANPPELKLKWSDNGQNVALFLNGEPWAFIHEAKRHGYSKGVLRPTIGNTWDQRLFEEAFRVG